ncbi:hypothetical protein Pmar_PMAR016848 [Perkinsus marinus ATCC 50983]|uniref:Uncharacterized protein n=1 Tax=Perkinsus marinus (strain ATCC 50983 / TXsc) TaxID=423536 RepID=C5LGB6_PERM5|nr:hypothetical protein Pmar_PMAR016848 [Perkinsus marinus ATCC 50983]EER04230.1 hypothetical protein Pmar_PMAR016848 [Perkinsus marinus ATCC 50983]|eukprot:XP_002772414.1 hypothetical protein Pmar_PMAR016848 [Perkinsus marinus ATCC 50983]
MVLPRGRNERGQFVASRQHRGPTADIPADDLSGNALVAGGSSAAVFSRVDGSVDDASTPLSVPPVPTSPQRTARPSPSFPYLPLELRSMSTPVERPMVDSVERRLSVMQYGGRLSRALEDARAQRMMRTVRRLLLMTVKEKRRLPEQTELGGPNQDIALGDAVKVARAWKSSSQYPKIELFRGDTDARDGKPARVVDKHMKHFRDACSFGDLLKEFWKVLYNEYSSSGDYFQLYPDMKTTVMNL